MNNDNENAGVTSSRIKFCVPQCEHASFPKEDGVDGAGSCRTFSALWCDLMKEYVTRNAPCIARFGRRRPKASW